MMGGRVERTLPRAEALRVVDKPNAAPPIMPPAASNHEDIPEVFSSDASETKVPRKACDIERLGAPACAASGNDVADSPALLGSETKAGDEFEAIAPWLSIVTKIVMAPAMRNTTQTARHSATRKKVAKLLLFCG